MTLKLVLVAGAVAAVAAGVLGGVVARELSLVGIHQGYAPEQPIAFSHKLHAGDNQVPCLYCHFGATKSRHAGIPPANVCMNCHSLLRKETPDIERLKEAVAQGRPLEWIKVHNLPDFVYFNHSQHVLSKVACQECHGPVETMARVRQEKPLTMGWCLDCHRQRGLAAARATSAALGSKAAPSSAHDGVVLAASGGVPSEHDPHRPLPGLDCGKCHY